jgi:DNA repair protein RecN (Recombination protein N)
MIEHLKVQDAALIEEAEVSFGLGLNVLTGETGAGKSILIDSINFVLGARVSADFVRSGAESAVVEAFFTTRQTEIIAAIKQLGVAIEEDGGIFISRSFNTQSKTICKINGKTVTIGMLREVASKLLDVHGQHEFQSLLDPLKHLMLLDRFCQEDLADGKARLAAFISEYRELARKIDDLEALCGSAQHSQLEFYRFQMEEIKAAKLSADESYNEEEALDARKRVLLNAEKIAHATHSLTEILGNIDMARAVELAHTIARLDSAQSQKDNALELAGLRDRLADLAQVYARYAEKLEFEPGELDEIEARLDMIYRLKKKYKKDISEILQYCNELEYKLNSIENSQEVLKKLNSQKKDLEKEIGRCCLILSAIRIEAAKALSSQIEDILKDLGMEDARFAIDIQRRKEFGQNGFDRVQFLISANKGEEIAPLDRIASGGEMSRIMLALKTALSNYDSIETFIFDEIDAGISGRTAQQVAEKLAIIGKTHQILCITHLPQIAAMGSANFLIEKIPQNERVVTKIHHLDENGVIAEIARLIGGAEITETTIKAAKEMRQLARLCRQ